MKNRILTGITTSGIPHLGNYFGAIRPSLDLANSANESFFFLADYHSIIKVNKPPIPKAINGKGMKIIQGFFGEKHHHNKI